MEKIEKIILKNPIKTIATLPFFIFFFFKAISAYSAECSLDARSDVVSDAVISRHDSTTGRLLAQLYCQGKDIAMRKFFEYDDEGRLLCVVSDNGSHEDSSCLKGATARHVATFTYGLDEWGQSQVLAIEENLEILSKETSSHSASIAGSRLFCEYDDHGNIVDHELQETSPIMAAKLLSRRADTLNKKGKRTHPASSLDDLLINIFGERFLKFAGYYPWSNPTSGILNEGQDLHPKVRITFINGILNLLHDFEYNVKYLGAAHGDATIHYVFRPTQGWTKDLCSCLTIKLGVLSQGAKLLAKKWKELIAEMGGVMEGGKIIHYAHSIGASDTFMAKDLLTQEERAMIHVITIGAPTLILPNSGFASVSNYVSKRDGICLLDPVRYFHGIYSDDSNVFFLGSFWGLPLVEHMLIQDTYRELIAELGARCQELYRATCLH